MHKCKDFVQWRKVQHIRSIDFSCPIVVGTGVRTAFLSGEGNLNKINPAHILSVHKIDGTLIRPCRYRKNNICFFFKNQWQKFVSPVFIRNLANLFDFFQSVFRELVWFFSKLCLMIIGLFMNKIIIGFIKRVWKNNHQKITSTSPTTTQKQ